MFSKIEALFGRLWGHSKPQSPSKMDVSECMRLLEEQAQPCVLANHSECPQLSKLGGLPVVEATFEWPTWNGSPLQFLCQLDLEEVQSSMATDWLPKAGVLSFFYDVEQSTWGFDPADRGSWRVFHFSDKSSLREAEPPVSLVADAILPEIFIEFSSARSLPPLDRLDWDHSLIPDEVYDLLDPEGDGAPPRHQIGGYPVPIQDDGMELECQLASNGIYVGSIDGYRTPEAGELASGSTDWQLLLQLDSDDDACMLWCDVGRLYFWVRKTDSVNGDFSKAWMILQCY